MGLKSRSHTGRHVQYPSLVCQMFHDLYIAIIRYFLHSHEIIVLTHVRIVDFLNSPHNWGWPVTTPLFRNMRAWMSYFLLKNEAIAHLIYTKLKLTKTSQQYTKRFMSTALPRNRSPQMRHFRCKGQAFCLFQRTKPELLWLL